MHQSFLFESQILQCLPLVQESFALIFCFVHLSSSVDCERLEGKAISHLTLVLPMPTVNITERRSRWKRVEMSVVILTFHSVRSY